MVSVGIFSFKRQTPGEKINTKGLEGSGGSTTLTDGILLENSFSKSERLLRSSEFLKVRRQGRRISSKRFTIYILPNGLEFRRLGLSVSKKVGTSPVRNRIKRLLREFFRLNKKSFPERSDIFISVKRADAATYVDVASELESVLGKHVSAK